MLSTYSFLINQSRNMSRKAVKVLLDSKIIPLKFKGSLYGGLIGDCTGAPYEGDRLQESDRATLKKYFDKLEGPMFKGMYFILLHLTLIFEILFSTSQKLHR